MGYDDIYRRSRECPDEFWAAAAASIDWYERWTQVLDQSNPPFYRWFSGGTLNTCHNALDRHVSAGRGDQAALIYDSAVTGTQATFSYAELTDRVASLAGATAPIGLVFAAPLAEIFGVGTWYLAGGLTCLVMGGVGFLLPALMRIEERSPSAAASSAATSVSKASAWSASPARMAIASP